MSMIQQICLHCGNQFLAPSHRVKAGIARFCSLPCHRKYRDRASLEQRLSSKTNKTESCWPWIGCISNWGYGVLQYQGKQILVHRAAYELFKAAIPEGMSVLHHCDVRHCLNPDHLYLGTQVENGSDMASRDRSLFGAKCHKAILDEAKVREAWLLRYIGLGPTEIAERFGVSKGAITCIFNRRNWRRVVPPVSSQH